MKATAYLTTIVYLDHDGESHHIDALVYAPNQQRAIDAAVTAVQELPHCAEVIGGALTVYEPDNAPAADKPNARGLTAPNVPPSRTVH